MTSTPLHSGLTATRFAGKPLRQPSYSMRDVPYCNKDLAGSTIGQVSDRDSFNDAMAEMVLLCNEVMRRKSELEAEAEADAHVDVRAGAHSAADTDTDANAEINTPSKGKKLKKMKLKKTKLKASKPLSLEYLADRCDVDDPIWGFIVRSDQTTSSTKTNTITTADADTDTNKKRNRNRNRNRNNSININTNLNTRMMQGFITVTTFTNWQASFRWDSMHDSAFSYDCVEMAEAMASKERVYDEDGSLAAEIQNTVRLGDPWNEGIVWPHLAEISLLGGLGCGKALLSLAIERLESMPATAHHNYHYVVLQATDNSIPFYESMGFVRVGAVTEKEEKSNMNGGEEGGDDALQKNIVSSPVVTVATKSKQSMKKFCNEHNVDVWDVIFLNKDVFPNISTNSVLSKDTPLYIPDLTKLDGSSNAALNQQGEKNGSGPGAGSRSVTQWYDAKDNESPREIAKKFDLCVKELLAANKGRIQGLQAHSKLVEGTRIQVSNLDVHYDDHVPYCHWTFPDDKFENNEPSYMMVRRLNRKNRQGRKIKPVEDSLAVKVTKYQVPPSAPQTPTHFQKVVVIEQPNAKTPKRKSKKRKLHPDQPIRPKKPKTGFLFFLDAERLKMKENNEKMKTADFFRRSSVRWKGLSESEKDVYNMKREAVLAQYEKDMKEYNVKMKKFKADHPDWEESVVEEAPAPQKLKMSKDLFNKVVRLNAEGRREAGTEYQYYYVLTYIPDLFWVHLAPMRQKGVFGTKWPKVKGKKRWVLVGEEEGKELDISATFCEVIKSRCMKRCNDADKEEWDITDVDCIDKTSLNTTSPPRCSSLSSTVSLASSTTKESAAAPSESSDCDVDTMAVDKVIETNTMYSRLLRRQQ